MSKNTESNNAETAVSVIGVDASPFVVRPEKRGTPVVSHGDVVRVGLPGTEATVPVDAAAYAEKILRGIEKASARLAYEIGARQLGLK